MITRLYYIDVPEGYAGKVTLRDWDLETDDIYRLTILWGCSYGYSDMTALLLF